MNNKPFLKDLEEVFELSNIGHDAFKGNVFVPYCHCERCDFIFKFREVRSKSLERLKAKLDKKSYKIVLKEFGAD